jgi:glycosyltransferase involved in cell wall biosynthesis
VILKSLKIIKKTLIIIFYNGFTITLKKIYRHYCNNGRKGVTKGINIDYKILKLNNQRNDYLKWIEQNEYNMEDSIEFNYNPLISIILPIYNIKKAYLREAIESVLNQSYKNWELCIADDASSLNETIELLKEYEKTDNIKVIYRLRNGHISIASNSALSLASGEYITFLDHDDTLAPFALFEIVKEINKNRDIKLIYSDEDKIDEYGKRYEPHFKPDWNPDMFFSQNYISHLMVIKKEIIEKTKRFRVGYEGSQDYDLILQSLKFINSDEIAHVTKILYHWRSIEGSTAKDSGTKEYTTDAGVKALEDYFTYNKNIQVKKGLLPNTYKIVYPIISFPLVSIIIPTKDNYELLSTCINSILTRSSYKNYEIIIIDNQTTQIEALTYLEYLNSIENIQVIKYNKIFNYAEINNYAVKYANGTFLAFLNNDIEVLHSRWLDEMLQHAQRKEIGIVGAKLYYPDRTIQHGGVILGIGGIAGHAHKYFEQDSHGYFSRLKIIQNYSALTAACIVMKKVVFDEVSGFEEELEIAYNDVDLSLKVLRKGYRNLWTPYAQLIHHESKSRGQEDTIEKRKRFEKEQRFMKKKWGKELLLDKCYNENLTLEDENFSLKIEEKN